MDFRSRPLSTALQRHHRQFKPQFLIVIAARRYARKAVSKSPNDPHHLGSIGENRSLSSNRGSGLAAGAEYS
jgi:hypothetical protein